MVYSARTLALLLALSISLVTTLFLSLVENVQTAALVVAGIISFSSSYLLVFVILEFLIFREINKIYRMLGKLSQRIYSRCISRTKDPHFCGSGFCAYPAGWRHERQKCAYQIFEKSC